MEMDFDPADQNGAFVYDCISKTQVINCDYASVTVNSMYRLSWATVPRYLVKLQSVCCWEGVFSCE